MVPWPALYADMPPRPGGFPLLIPPKPLLLWAFMSWSTGPAPSAGPSPGAQAACEQDKLGGGVASSLLPPRALGRSTPLVGILNLVEGCF